MPDTVRFRTRTEFMERRNGTLPDMWLVGLDAGYSSIKTFSSNAVSVFPAFAQPFRGDTIGALPDTHYLLTDHLTGTRWVVGDAAERAVMPDDMTVSDESLYGEDRYDDPMFRVLVETGLALGMTNAAGIAPDGRTIHVQTGLPPKYLKKDSGRMVDVIAGHHSFSLQRGSHEPAEYDFTIDRSHVYLMEQPKGSVMSVIATNQHGTTDDAEQIFASNTLVLDGGFRTLDTYPIQNRHVLQPQTFPEYGMIQVLQMTADQIDKTYHTQVSSIGMQECLRRGYVRCHTKFSSEDKPFQDMLLAADKAVCGKMLDRIAQVYPLYDYNYLIVTGGAGAAWNSMIRDTLKGLHGLTILGGNRNDSQLPYLMMNARGYFHRLYFLLSSRIRM